MNQMAFSDVTLIVYIWKFKYHNPAISPAWSLSKLAKTCHFAPHIMNWVKNFKLR